MIITPAAAGLQSALEAISISPYEIIVLIDHDQWDAFLSQAIAEGERVQPGDIIRFGKIGFRRAS